MEIRLNESEKSIQIKDGLQNQYLILKILMILNLANAILRLYGKSTNEYGFLEYIWIVLGVISLILLYLFLFKMSTAEKIDIEEIIRIKEKNVFGKKRFQLDLKNGRKRYLGNFKNEIEVTELRALFDKTGIRN